MHVLQSAVTKAGASLCRAFVARVADQNLAHKQRTDSDEMRFVPKLPSELVVQTQVGLVDKCRCLQRARRWSAAKLLASDSTQLVIEQRHQPAQRIMVSFSPHGQKCVDFRRIARWHRPSSQNRSRD